MRLKKLEILGFKSFADKAVLEFHEGVTAIVGPNGCGKSNISDAFRWVLGEQSAKSMRGGKMNDVIFAGTTYRAPLNYAEVTITLTDVAGVLPIDYDEVSITRRLHKSGESVYLINKHPVRLKDVHDLLLGSGIGKNAFSIFEQGKIDQIIHYSPIERRCIFEEAAGILRFLQRKRESLRKLEQVDLNLSRVKDIHQEVEKQIAVLEKQAEKARVFKEKKAQLEHLDKALFVAKWDQLQKRNAEARKKQETQQEKLAAKTTFAGELDEQLKEARVNLTQSDKALRSKSEEIIKMRGEKEMKSRERQSQHERIKELTHKEKKWQQELEALAERRTQRQAEATAMQKQQADLEELLRSQEEIVQEQRELVHTLESTVAEMRDQQQAHQQEVMKLVQTENQIESELKQNAVRQENQFERRESLQERKEKLAKTIAELSQHAADKKRDMQAAAKAVDEQKELFSLLEQKLHDLQEEIQKGQHSLEEAQHEIAEAKARQKVLLRLRDDMEGFSAGSKRLLHEATDPQSPLHKRVRGLYEFIAPKDGKEAALAAILRPYAQTLVVDSAEDFEIVTGFAKENDLKDFSLVCLATLPEQQKLSKEPSKAESLLKSVVDHVLATHFLKHVYVVGKLADAQQLAQKHPGTAAWMSDDNSATGKFLDPNGVLFYTAPGENNVFMREAEIKTLEKKLASLEEQRKECDATLKQRQLQRNEFITERTALDKSIRRDEMTLVEVNFGLQRLNNELEKAVNEDKQLTADLKAIEALLETLALTIETLKQKHNATKTKASQLQQHHAALHSELELKLNTLKREKQILQEKEILYRKGIDDHKKLLHSIHILEVKDSESKQQELRLHEEIQSSGSLQEHISKQGTEVERSLQDVEAALTVSIAACTSLEQEVAQKKSIIENIEQQVNKERSGTRPIEEELQRIGIQIAQLETTSNSLVEELQERYHLTIEEAQALGLAIEKSIEQTERQVRGLRQDVSQSGDINMTAIEEFEQHQTRYSYLSQQMGDLDASKAELVQIISQLDTESRKIFKETFDKIRENFKKNFQILFNGGEADLQFTDTNDVLEAGIEIIAKPPGKQMRSIQLLSGGEKCMTAVALLFAIFEVKPAPFCILDEIDAPLDESNVERFINVVRQFIDRCQFLIITHNKRTMTAADVIFGVSMEERGVSKLLSMSFSKKEKAGEPALSVH